MFGIALAIFYEVSQDPLSGVSDLSWTVLFSLAIIAAIFGVIVALVENFVPVLRIPAGSAWAAVGHNRWIAAAILGLIPGTLLIPAGGNWVFVVLTSVGVVAAEALVGRPAARKTAG